MRKILLLAMVGLLVSGCVVGNTHRYDLGDAAFEVETDKNVAVCVADLRPYILSGEKPGSFVGLMRGGFGNPFDATTSSGKTLSIDMETSIVEALKSKNVRAFAVSAPPRSGEAKTREVLLGADADRFVLMVLREWKTDTYFNAGLHHNVTLTVLKKDGSKIAEKVIGGGVENLGVVVVPADARVKAEAAFRQKLELLFNDPDVVAALK